MDKHFYKLGIVIAFGLLLNGFVGIANLLNWHGSPAYAKPQEQKPAHKVTETIQKVILCDTSGNPLNVYKPTGATSSSLSAVVSNPRIIEFGKEQDVPVSVRVVR